MVEYVNTTSLSVTNLRTTGEKLLLAICFKATYNMMEYTVLLYMCIAIYCGYSDATAYS